MRKILYILVFSLIFLFSIGLFLIYPANDNVKVLADGNNLFAFDLYKVLARKEGNILVSPYSISSALAMTYAGARGNTKFEMKKVLHFNLEDEHLHKTFSEINNLFNAPNKNYQLAIANSLWGQIDYPFKKDFVDLIKENYGAGFYEVDFINEENREKTRLRINKWVEDNTNNKIKDLILPDDLTYLTRLVLVNALYFKGNWEYKFDPKETNPMDFYLSKDKKLTVPMMHQKNKFNYTENDDIQVLELPYAGGDLSMLIILPKKEKSLEVAEKYLSLEEINKLISDLRENYLDVYFPKFKTEKRYLLNEPLKDLGMIDPFDRNLADFSGITGDKDLVISKMIHKTYIEVNEEGTEASAATAVILELKAVYKPIVFKADRPFIFLIRDRRTGIILFIGRIVNPLE
ncbi:MAG: serine/threonine protein phosphatase [Dictyoglomus sp. NZ13-RE01]|nr:MAG: serine/threonine protein phosphatase [Dictyoglomus sp. NZ13-RE01]